jgi:non-heme chloroperoxidase
MNSGKLTILTEKQEKAVEHGLPTARFISLSGANHFVFLSNETEVLRYMSSFLAELH